MWNSLQSPNNLLKKQEIAYPILLSMRDYIPYVFGELCALHR